MPADRELVFTRVLSAPRSRVFTAWTDPKHVVPWSNPLFEVLGMEAGWTQSLEGG